MEQTTLIKNFLDRIRKQKKFQNIATGFYLTLTIFSLGFILFNFSANFLPHKASYFEILGIITFFPFLYVLFIRFFPAVFSSFSREQAALLVESHNPQLKNSLINSLQLHSFLNDPEANKKTSTSFIENLVRETCARLDKIDIKPFLNNREANRNRNIMLILFTVLIFTGWLVPGFFTSGYQKYLEARTSPPVINVSSNSNPLLTPDPTISIPFSISKIKIKLNYPAYTRLPSEESLSSQGKILALPGTEVIISAKSNLPLSKAELAINGKDTFSMMVKNQSKLAGSFIVGDSGYYQFQVIAAGNKRVLIPKKYPITLKKDHHPKIILLLSNPKPVYHENDKVQFYYEASDDFGIQKIDLVYSINDKQSRKLLKNIRGFDKTIKDGYIWNLNQWILEPGDEIQYYLEIQDNDSVRGPNIGQSEIFSFTIFNSKQEMEDLIALQEELIDRLISLLAKTLTDHQLIKTGTLKDSMSAKKMLASRSDELIEIIRLVTNINSQAKPLDFFPQSYLTLFENIISGLTKIREEQIELIGKLGASTGETISIGYHFPPIGPVNENLIGHLERDILFLVKISNRQKMDRVMDLEKQLQELTQSLREEFENFENKKSPDSPIEFKKRLDKLKDVLNKIMDHLSRQTQGLPDEFLNPNSFKQLNMKDFKASLDEIMNLVNEGKIDKAMKKLNELNKDFQTLANQLDQVMNSMDQMMDMEIMKQIDQSLQEILKLEKNQNNLIDQSTRLNQGLRKSQVDYFEDKLKEFFAALKKDVNAAQTLLGETQLFLDDNPDLTEYNKLLDQEAKLNLELQDRSQEATDSALKDDFEKKVLKLRESRQKLADITSIKQDLHMETYQDFKNFMPELEEKYNGLEELADLFDIREFNNLFKNTYPLAYRWQHKLKMESSPYPELYDPLQEYLDELRQINSEISKKLGSMMRKLENQYNALLSKQDKQKLNQMAKDQSQTRKITENLIQKLEDMSQKNPLFPPDVSRQMSSARRYMKMAEKNLRKPDINQSIENENGALQKLAETGDMLNELKNSGQNNSESSLRPTPKFGNGRARDPRRGGSVRMQRERVDLPSEDQYQSPQAFRGEILEAMKNNYPKQYERFITEYYKELVK